MDIDALLNEAEDKLRMAGDMVRSRQDPAVITALSTYAGACATLAGARINSSEVSQASAERVVQETHDGEALSRE